MGSNGDLTRSYIDEAYADHLKSLFASMVRHLQGNNPDVDGARKEFRKGLSIARQARSEMQAIAEEAT